MHRCALRLFLVVVLIVAALAPASAAASPPMAPSASRGALAVPHESVARLWAWLTSLLLGSHADLAPAAIRPEAGGSASGVHPDDGAAIDPNG
jgi:hypothetical protein